MCRSVQAPTDLAAALACHVGPCTWGSVMWGPARGARASLGNYMVSHRGNSYYYGIQYHLDQPPWQQFITMVYGTMWTNRHGNSLLLWHTVPCGVVDLAYTVPCGPDLYSTMWTWPVHDQHHGTLVYPYMVPGWLKPAGSMHAPVVYICVWAVVH